MIDKSTEELRCHKLKNFKLVKEDKEELTDYQDQSGRSFNEDREEIKLVEIRTLSSQIMAHQNILFWLKITCFL